MAWYGKDGKQYATFNDKMRADDAWDKQRTEQTMQNALLANNIAASNLVNTSERMLNSVSFGNSQPLRPTFSSGFNEDDLLIKANETKLSVSAKLFNSLRKKLSADIKNSTPKYAGLDYKA